MALIVLADDDGATCDMIRRALEADHHHVSVFHDGSSALHHIRSGAPVDLLVTDVNMPEVDGFALAREAVAKIAGLKLLVISGHAEQLDQLRGIGAKNSDVLAKPFSLEVLRKKVRDLLA